MTISRSPPDDDAEKEKTVSIAGKIKFGDKAHGHVFSTGGKVVQTGGGVYVGGSVDTGGGDFVGRDQLKTVYPPGASVDDLRKLVAEIRNLLPRADLDSDVEEAIEGDFDLIEEQMANDRPRGALIKPRLKGILEMIQEAGKTTEAVEKLAKLLGRGVALAGALF